jgi:endonuclease/exonuclease/phosphatase family metal-dependent hydrolase
MTRNLYLGADLTGLLTAANPILGIVQIVSAVTASQPAQRMADVAQEITAHNPDLVALQEVADWHIGGLNPLTGDRILPSAHYDFLALLRRALAAAGEPYDVVVSQANFESGDQLAMAAPLATFTDRDVILVRRGLPVSQLQVLDTGGSAFDAQLEIPVLSLGVTIDFDRGYEWADVRTRGKVWRIVNTHPEAYSPADLGLGTGDVNGDQAEELAEALEDVTVPVLLLGDLNSRLGDPKRAGYAVLDAADFTDTWLALGKSDAASTCCYDQYLAGGTLHERIDHVLMRGAVTANAAEQVGVAALRSTAPRWASDHAGVVTSVSIGKQ